MTFLYPNVLYALILPALLAAAAWWLWRRRSRKWEVLVSPEYRRELVHAPATWHRVLPVIFAVGRLHGGKGNPQIAQHPHCY